MAQEIALAGYGMAAMFGIPHLLANASDSFLAAATGLVVASSVGSSVMRHLFYDRAIKPLPVHPTMQPTFDRVQGMIDSLVASHSLPTPTLKLLPIAAPHITIFPRWLRPDVVLVSPSLVKILNDDELRGTLAYVLALGKSPYGRFVRPNLS